MGINFPDLQVLLPRTEEIGRVPAVGQQQDVNQQALAQAALVQTERDRKRVAFDRKGERSGRSRKERPEQREAQPRTLRDLRGKGDRLDIRA